MVSLMILYKLVNIDTKIMHGDPIKERYHGPIRSIISSDVSKTEFNMLLLLSGLNGVLYRVYKQCPNLLRH